MRALAWSLMVLLALTPLSLAEGDSDSSSSSSPSPDDREDAEDLRDGNESEDDDAGDNQTHHEEDRFGPGCRNGNRTADELQRCRRAVDRIDDEHGRAWIAFRTDPVNATLLDYRVAGLLALDALHLDLDGANLTLQRAGSTLFVRDGEAELRLHDEPNGLIRFKGDGNVTLDFPANVTVASSEHGARLAYPGGREGHLLADNATWLANDTVHLTGFFAFHLPPAQALSQRPAETEDADEAKERVQEAIERRSVGAEVSLRAPGPQGAMRDGTASDVEVLAYDDVEVDVELPAEPSPEAPVRVVVSSELDEGRTIVLNVDGSLLASDDPRDLVLRYFDLHNQTDGSVLETEVLFAAATSLQDVLDPADDGGQPEYWVVQDANGLQVLVSVPHWSAHAITVASFVTALDAPSVLVGISVGAGMTVLFGVAMLWPRRRQDEF